MGPVLNFSRPAPGDLPEAGVGTVQTDGYTRPSSRVMQAGDLDDLVGLPGTPAYARRMETQRADAIARGENPDRVEIEQPAAALVLPEGYGIPDLELIPSSAPVAAPVPPARRVAIYNGKGDTYNVMVESAPDWDTETLLKGHSDDEVKLLLKLAQALGVKIVDKSGEFEL